MSQLEKYSLLERGVVFLNTHCSRMVVFATGMALLYNHDIPTIVFTLGTIGNMQLTKLLKRSIQQRRPEAAVGVKKSHGMPSSHASSLAFFATHLSLIVWTTPDLGRQTRLLLPAAMWLYTATICYARMSLQCVHTPAQLLCGVGVGVGTGLLWYRCAFMPVRAAPPLSLFLWW
eukprot:m.114537 g.114537  ORF g.114537 m.114537 type:complete len:174 (-) comp19355_c0_seq4:268-789(-)